MTVVVPPRRAARVPVKKSSAVVVFATSRSKWVWASMKPGKRKQPVTSTVRSAVLEVPPDLQDLLTIHQHVHAPLAGPGDHRAALQQSLHKNASSLRRQCAGLFCESFPP